MVHPNSDDVVVRHATGDVNAVHLLGTPSAPDQFSFSTRDEAVSKAVAYAKHQHVRAWFAKGEDHFVLLGTFRPEEQVEPVTAVTRERPVESRRMRSYDGKGEV
jgi:hypothetical protein